MRWRRVRFVFPDRFGPARHPPVYDRPDLFEPRVHLDLDVALQGTGNRATLLGGFGGFGETRLVHTRNLTGHLQPHFRDLEALSSFIDGARGLGTDPGSR